MTGGHPAPGTQLGLELGPSPELVALRAKRGCLDYRSKSDTPRPGHDSQVVNRARVFRTGEVEVRTVLRDARSRPPRPAYGPRVTRGVSGRGRRTIRRAVGAFVQSQPCRPALYTLTSQELVSDAAFSEAFAKWLKWLRKYAPMAATHYVWAKDLQARGVLHAHVLLFRDIPPKVWRRLRRLWAVTYGMGPGSFDVKRVRRPSRTAGYIARYLSRQHDGGNRRVGRNGEPYVRETFAGNAYGVSDALRSLALPVTEFVLPWSTGPVLGAVNLRGCVLFFEGVDAAHAALASALGPPLDS